MFSESSEYAVEEILVAVKRSCQPYQVEVAMKLHSKKYDAVEVEMKLHPRKNDAVEVK
jgi:hypothetical protein